VTTLRTLKKLVLGETWLLPLGLAAVLLVSAFVVRPLLGSDAWSDVGGFVLLAGVLVVLVAAVRRLQ
jgi:hypothetical protein